MGKRMRKLNYPKSKTFMFQKTFSTTARSPASIQINHGHEGQRAD